MRCSNVVRTLRLLAAAALVVTAACGDSPESPSPAPLVLTMPAAVEGRYSTCQTCADPIAVVVTFAVTVTDASGPGGTIATLETRVMDTSRGVEVARNTRPNGSVGLSPSALPASVTPESTSDAREFANQRSGAFTAARPSRGAPIRSLQAVRCSGTPHRRSAC